MAEKLCQLKKKGGSSSGGAETLLWTNPSPTSSQAMSTITLSDNYTNYDLIKVEIRRTTGDPDIKVSTYISTNDFASVGYVGQDRKVFFMVAASDLSGYVYYRSLHPVSPNQIQFSAASNGSGTNNVVAVITNIYGVKWS